MAGEGHGRGMGTACYVWIGLYRVTEHGSFMAEKAYVCPDILWQLSQSEYDKNDEVYLAYQYVHVKLSFLHVFFRQSTSRNLFSSKTNKMQRYTIYLFLWNALHVSGGSSAHHQGLKTVYPDAVYTVELLMMDGGTAWNM